MEAVLKELGLSPKEARLYLYLLEEGENTAAELSKQHKESRTNTYMLLEHLADSELIERDDTRPVRKYRATAPSALKNKLNEEARRLKQSQILLNDSLPQLESLFSLGNHKPGVMYFEGLEGYKTLLDDMAKTTGNIDLIGSDLGPVNNETWAVLEKGLAKRKARGIRTRALFQETAREWADTDEFIKKGLEIRFWGKAPLEGETVMYADKIAFTVYKPQLIVTVMTNDVLAQTYRVIFEQLWQQAKS